MSSKIHVQRVVDRDEPQASIVLDRRVWNEKMPTGKVRIELPELIDSERSFRIQLRRRNEIRYKEIANVRKNSNSIDLDLSHEQEKHFQTGNSKEPFKLQVFDESSVLIYQARFFRFKSENSKLFKEMSEQVSRIETSKQNESRGEDRTPQRGNRDRVLNSTQRQFNQNLDIDELFVRGKDLLDRSLQSIDSDPFELSSIKPSPNWAQSKIFLNKINFRSTICKLEMFNLITYVFFWGINILLF